MQTLRAQWRLLLAELAKFGIVGVINTLLDFGLFNALHFGAHIGPLTAQAMATIVSATTSYFMNRHWTFSHRARTSLRREYVMFFFLNFVGLMIMEACIGVTRYGFGLESVAALNIAKVVGLVLGTMFRFVSYKRWVFLPDEAGADHASGGAAHGEEVSAATAARLSESGRLVEFGPAQEEPERRRA